MIVEEPEGDGCSDWLLSDPKRPVLTGCFAEAQ